jgi:hypothetical protein
MMTIRGFRGAVATRAPPPRSSDPSMAAPLAWSGLEMVRRSLPSQDIGGFRSVDHVQRAHDNLVKEGLTLARDDLFSYSA